MAGNQNTMLTIQVLLPITPELEKFVYLGKSECRLTGFPRFFKLPFR